RPAARLGGAVAGGGHAAGGGAGALGALRSAAAVAGGGGHGAGGSAAGRRRLRRAQGGGGLPVGVGRRRRPARAGLTTGASTARAPAGGRPAPPGAWRGQARAAGRHPTSTVLRRRFDVESTASTGGVRPPTGGGHDLRSGGTATPTV